MTIVYEAGDYRVEAFGNGKYGIWNKRAKMYVTPLNCPIHFSTKEGAIKAADSLNNVDNMWMRFVSL